MSLGAQLRSLGRLASRFRQDLFGTALDGSSVTIDYDRGQIPALVGYYTPVRDEAQTGEAGYIDKAEDAIVRIPKATAPSTFVPELHKQIKVTESRGTEVREILLTVEHILGSHVSSTEWVLGCMAAN